MKIQLIRIISLMLLIACMSVIFGFSSQDATQSGDISGETTSRIFTVVYPGFSDMTFEEQQQVIESVSFPIRKTAHFSIYFTLGVFAFLSLITYRKISFYLRPAFAWSICILYATSDEIHQLFVPGRSGEVRDVVLDSCGALLSIVLATLICRCRGKLFTGLKTIR